MKVIGYPLLVISYWLLVIRVGKGLSVHFFGRSTGDAREV